MKITVDVTQEDIDRGVRGNARLCPVALALARAGNTTWENVVASAMDLHLNKHRWHPTAEVKLFILNFDGGLPVVPFTFEADFEPYKTPTAFDPMFKYLEVSGSMHSVSSMFGHDETPKPFKMQFDDFGVNAEKIAFENYINKYFNKKLDNTVPKE